MKNCYLLNFYQDTRDEWRWRLTASNGEIIGASCEGYKNRMDAENNISTILSLKPFLITYELKDKK